MKKLLRWPRGKYNGLRIVGFKVSFQASFRSFDFFPRWGFGSGEPYFIWIIFTVRAKPIYSLLA